MKDEPVHEFDHAAPTVIQHHDEDMTVLARWLQRGMEQGPKFWILVLAVVAAMVAVVVLASGLQEGNVAKNEGWVKLIPAKTADDKIKIADEFPSSSVSHWARLQAAMEEYDGGFMALVDPRQRDLIAGPRLKKALGYFKQVAQDAPIDSVLRPIAALGIGRTLEALNQLPEAIRQYKLVAETYKDSPEAKQAESLAKVLDEPESIAFYKELYAATAPALTNPDIPRPKIPGFTFPDPGKSFLPSIPNMPAPADLPAPPPAGAAPATTPPVDAPKVEAPKPDAPKVEAPAKPADAPKPAADPSTSPPK